METENFFLIVYTLVSLGMVVFLFSVGNAMFQIKSFEQRFEAFKKHPEKATLVEKYFFLWVTPVALATTRWALKNFGNKFMTTYYRVSGFIYFIFGAFFLFGLVMVWIAALL